MGPFILALLLTCIPPPADHRSLHRLGWPVLLAGATLDAVSTSIALSRPGTIEANPVMRPLAGRPSVLLGVKLGANVLLGWGLEKLAARHPRRALLIAVLAGSAQLAIGLHNLRTR
jgi:predicted lysophospholipase L1 biosynthesis ABC-type transport system permease subunit